MMEASLLYKLHGHNQKPGVTADPNRFREVFTSKYGKVRIFKVLGVSEESKAFVADPANRDCDVEGGWFCRGIYPPALESTLQKKNDFAQLEDFNKKKNSEADAEDYQRQ
jgi:dolichyl-diphosphooligosaccharide--protein glycosyltransferase